MLWKILAFSIVTLVLVYISRASLLHPRSHGFYRFFAWEAILALFLLNVDYWFVEPFAWYQIIAWILLVASIVPAIWGVVLLRRGGKPVERRAGDPSLLAFEKTTSLVTTEIYKTIRHPLYSSLLLLAWGIFFKSPSLSGGGLVAAATLFLFLTARADEAECVKFFGTAYEDYMKKTKRFIPFLF
ncbi:MAG: phospholipid methyltransferase domain-containing protein [Anaerolineaceae bacterium]|nr:MAG: phospholipid methyltransferase domain-containing protein [Anaerolineaceae bacterium]